MSSRMVSVKIHKPSISILKSSKIYEKEKTIYNCLIRKYSQFEYSYSLVCINNLIFNEQCMIVARFKDFLFLDDMTEFLRRFYSKKELKRRLSKIFNFYESYSKIFPNYMILTESKYLYRNIRKKQKMIDAFNQIKKEEEENRKSLKKELDKKEKEEITIFNKSIQESINRYHPSCNSFMRNSNISGYMKNNYHNNESNWNSLISISLNKAYPLNNNKNSNFNSFDLDNNEITVNSENSLKNIVQILNQKYENNNTNSNKENISNIIKDEKNKKNNRKNQNQNNHKKINDNPKIKKNTIKKETKIKKVKPININQNNTKIEKEKEREKEKEKEKDIIRTPPKHSPSLHTQIINCHNHRKSALNNNKKLIYNKQVVYV